MKSSTPIAALAACLLAAACSQPPPAPASTSDAAKPAGDLLRGEEIALADLTARGFRRTESRFAPREPAGWVAAEAAKINVRYQNPERWPADPLYNVGGRPHLVAICPAAKEIVIPWLEPRGPHASLDLPGAGCQLRWASGGPHGEAPARLHHASGACALEAPAVPAGVAAGAVVDLGDPFAKCAK